MTAATPGGVLDVAERLWTGAVSTTDVNPVLQTGELEEVAPGVAFAPSFANVTAVTTDAGLLLVDTGSQLFEEQVHGQVRRWSPARLDTAVYSHGHVDHVFGVPRYEAEAAEQGWAPPTVVAHAAVSARFDRYVLTNGYNAVINRRQFQVPDLQWPTSYRHPDRTYRDRLDLDVGGVAVALTHARGETDDATWAWLPEQRVLCPGDLFVWSSPNAGNPQKVQRYAAEWAQALRAMAALDAELMLPGHGYPVVGATRVRQALDDTAELLESLVEQSLALLNAGARLDELLHTVRVPAHLADRPYLQPVYDEPEFVVRNIWRLYGGWYDGNPATLKPAREAALAAELASLAGGAGVLADRALALASAATASDADLRVAGHLAETAALAAPGDAGVQAARAEVFGRRAEMERSTMSRGVFSWAAAESRRAAERPDG